MKEEVSLEVMLKEVVEELVTTDPEYAELAALAKWAHHKQSPESDTASPAELKPVAVL